MANIIVTGASSGIGFETVLELVKNPKHTVVALARSQEKLAKLLEISSSLNQGGGKLYVAQFDIVYGDYTSSLIPYLKEKLGSIDILINNAGELVNKPFLETTLEDFSTVFQTNFLAPVQMIKYLFHLFSTNSHILNIGSMGGYQGSVKFPGLSAYSASKSALANLTESLAEEFKEHNIKVNCLALGSSQTEMFEKAFPNLKAGTLAFEMGQYVADFAVNGSKYYNGKILPVASTTP